MSHAEDYIHDATSFDHRSSETRAISSSGECSFVMELLRGYIFPDMEWCIQRRVDMALGLAGK